MPSLKYSNAACFKLHHCFHQRQMEAGREPESLFITTGQLNCSAAYSPDRLPFYRASPLISQEDIMLTSNSWSEHDSGRIEKDVSPWKRDCSVHAVEENCSCGTWARLIKQQYHTNWFVGVPYCTQHCFLLQHLACQNMQNVSLKMTDIVWLPHGVKYSSSVYVYVHLSMCVHARCLSMWVWIILPSHMLRLKNNQSN